MSSRTSFRFAPPQRLYESYKAIRNSELIANKTLNDSTISELKDHLNASVPVGEDETTTHSLVQFLYRKNPVNFCKFLLRSRLNHLMLWTEAKCIVRHFGLQGVVYVKWDDSQYECSRHRNFKNNVQGNVCDDDTQLSQSDQNDANAIRGTNSGTNSRTNRNSGKPFIHRTVHDEYTQSNRTVNFRYNGQREVKSGFHSRNRFVYPPQTPTNKSVTRRVTQTQTDVDKNEQESSDESDVVVNSETPC
jgi:hypothetical protein